MRSLCPIGPLKSVSAAMFWIRFCSVTLKTWSTRCRPLISMCQSTPMTRSRLVDGSTVNPTTWRLTLLCHGIESTLLGWFYDLIFTCCLCAGNSLFIESTQKGRFYGSKSSQPGYVPLFIGSPQMGRFYESEPARPWLYRQKLLIRDICPSTCLLSWFLKKIRAKIDKQKRA